MESRTIQRRQMLRNLTLGGLASALLIGTDSGPGRRAAPVHPLCDPGAERRTHRTERERAKVFGGHAEKALKAVDDAIEQLQRALDFGDRD